jgi:hypothetical protein
MNKEQFPITHYEYMINEYNWVKDVIRIVNEHYGKDSENVTFVDFANWFISLERFSALMDGLGANQSTFAMNLFYHIWRMKTCGEKIYYISPQLFSMLLNTDVTVDSQWIKTPFEEIYLYLDQKEVLIDDFSDGSICPIKGVYINFKKHDAFNNRMRFILTGGFDAIKQYKDVNYYFSIDIPECGKTIEDIIDSLFEKINDQKMHVFDMSETNQKATRLMIRFVLNLMIYITSPSADMFDFIPDKISIDKKSPKKIEKAMRKLSRTAQIPFIMVGYKLPKLPQSSLTSTHGHSITYKFEVSGHWRMQWKGTKKIEGSLHQEPIWIKPYHKGENLAEGIHKKYIVQGGGN